MLLSLPFPLVLFEGDHHLPKYCSLESSFSTLDMSQKLSEMLRVMKDLTFEEQITPLSGPSDDARPSKKRKIQPAAGQQVPVNHSNTLSQVYRPAEPVFERSLQGVTKACDHLFASWEEASRLQRSLFNRYMLLPEKVRDMISANVMHGFEIIETVAASLMDVEVQLNNGLLDQACEQLQAVYVSLQKILARCRELEMKMSGIEQRFLPNVED